MRKWYNLLLSRQAKALDLSDLGEECRDALLVDLEGQVTNEDGITLRAHLIVELLGAVAGTGSRVVLGLSARDVKTHVAAVEVGTVLLFQSSLGVLSSVEVDIAEAPGAAILPVGDDAGICDTLAVLELIVEEVVVDVPAKVANEEGGALLRGVLGLGLLRRALSSLLSLALLGGEWCLGLLRIAVGVGGVIGIGGVRVFLVGL